MGIKPGTIKPWFPRDPHTDIYPFEFIDGVGLWYTEFI